MLRDHVFVSYSHKDTDWLDLLRDQLAPDLRNDRGRFSLNNNTIPNHD